MNDLPRTFSSIDFFNPETELGRENKEKLKKVLESFAVMRPDIGYVQGMSYICGFILMHTDSEFSAFKMFNNLILNPQLTQFYKFESSEIIQKLKFFRSAFLEELPELCEYFEEEKIDPRNYVYEWVMTMFTRALSPEVAV